MKVYAPVWFHIKTKSACTEGSRHLWRMIKYSRYLEQPFRDIIDPVIQRNGYFGHSENILMAMLTDDKKTYQGTRNETDRLDYRASCRRANFLIKDSRKKHLAQTISSCSSSKQRWKTVNNLLHPNSRNNSAANNNSINSTTFLDFFTTKLTILNLP